MLKIVNRQHKKGTVQICLRMINAMIPGHMLSVIVCCYGNLKVLLACCDSGAYIFPPLYGGGHPNFSY